jgi:DNA-binding transcriptional LysR family regulator
MFDNLNYYRVFYTVANTGNISKAADMLFISQPAISKAISKLEDGLHVKLFLRSSKGVTLTDEGQVLYNHIEKAFSNISQGEDEIRHIHELGIGQLKIGVSTSLCKHILLDKLQTFILENPHIKVIIDCHSTVNTLKLLNDGRIDIGLICKTDIPAGFEYQDVSTIHDIFVVNETYLSNRHFPRPTHKDCKPSRQTRPTCCWKFHAALRKRKPTDKVQRHSLQSIPSTVQRADWAALTCNRYSIRLLRKILSATVSILT